MEQYTTATTTTGEQIVVQTSNGQIQQQVNTGFTLIRFGCMRKVCPKINNLTLCFKPRVNRYPQLKHSSGFQPQSFNYLSATVLSCIAFRHRAQ